MRNAAGHQELRRSPRGPPPRQRGPRSYIWEKLNRADPLNGPGRWFSLGPTLHRLEAGAPKPRAETQTKPPPAPHPDPPKLRHVLCDVLSKLLSV